MEERLELQIERLFELAQRGSVATGRFFNPEEQYRAQQYLHQTGYAQDTYTFYGGYETAERKALICLPEWCQGTFEPSLAALCGISTVYFRKTFETVFGVSPIRYLHDLRIGKAKAILSGDYDSIRQVAESTGYSSVYHFSKMFKLYTGQSPSTYAKSIRK